MFFFHTSVAQLWNVNFVDDHVRKDTYLLEVADSPWPTFNISPRAERESQKQCTQLGTSLLMSVNLAHLLEPRSSQTESWSALRSLPSEYDHQTHRP